MTIPHARKITVADVEYLYALKPLSTPRLAGNTPGRMKLIVEMTKGEYVTVAFQSKAWTEEHEDGEPSAPVHKVGFLPSDVHFVIATLTFFDGELPARFDLPAWRRIAVKTKPRPAEKKPARARHSIGSHLSADDLRAVVFEDPAFTVDFTRAQLHVKSCEVCRDMVERERAENPLFEPENV